MIKNIVFDMGRVLVDYEGDKVCRLYIEDEAERRAVTATVFDSQEWLLLDMGLLSEEEALKRMQARLETDHAKEMAAK
jgi:putative hydrolase of the HAD superfamily